MVAGTTLISSSALRYSIYLDSNNLHLHFILQIHDGHYGPLVNILIDKITCLQVYDN